jgi:hypothetical protein
MLRPEFVCVESKGVGYIETVIWVYSEQTSAVFLVRKWLKGPPMKTLSRSKTQFCVKLGLMKTTSKPAIHLAYKPGTSL